jgi:hypothetical protein
MTYTPDGGYMIIGQKRQWYAYGITKLIKVNSSGDMIWDTTIYDPPFPEVSARSITAVAGGGYAIAGSFQTDTSSSHQGYVARLSESGSPEWEYVYPSDTNESRFSDIIEASNGDFVAVGYVEDSSYYNRGLVIRLDADGILIWADSLDGSQGTLRYVMELSNGDLVVEGTASLFSKINADGTILWQKPHEGVDFALASDGGFFLAGDSSANIRITKTNAAGDSLWARVTCAGGTNMPMRFSHCRMAAASFWARIKV